MTEHLIRPIADQVEDIFHKAAAELTELMRRNGEAVSVAFFLAALTTELTEEQLAREKAGEVFPPALKWVANLKDAASELEFLGQLAEGLAQDEIVSEVLTKQ